MQPVIIAFVAAILTMYGIFMLCALLHGDHFAGYFLLKRKTTESVKEL